jgi:hypothetical protein
LAVTPLGGVADHLKLAKTDGERITPAEIAAILITIGRSNESADA